MQPVCPQCKKVVHQQEWKELLTPEEYSDIESRQLDITIARNPKLVKCDCNAVMEMEPGKVDYKAKDDKGAIMSR